MSALAFLAPCEAFFFVKDASEDALLLFMQCIVANYLIGSNLQSRHDPK